MTNAPRALALLLWAITASSTVGCAIFSKGAQGTSPRFFSLDPTPAGPAAVPANTARAQGKRAELRLGHVTGAPHLEERLVFRNSAYEINYYQELRWTEPPELSLKRLLARVLFEERGLRQVVGGAAPTLDVQLTAFDEIRLPRRLARAQLVARLYDEHLVLWEETLTVDRPVVTNGGVDLAVATVEALRGAMQAAVNMVADRVVRELEQRR